MSCDAGLGSPALGEGQPVGTGGLKGAAALRWGAETVLHLDYLLG